MQDIVNIYKFIEVENIPSVCFYVFLIISSSSSKKKYNPHLGKKNKLHITIIVNRKIGYIQIPTKEL